MEADEGVDKQNQDRVSIAPPKCYEAPDWLHNYKNPLFYRPKPVSGEAGPTAENWWKWFCTSPPEVLYKLSTH